MLNSVGFLDVDGLGPRFYLVPRAGGDRFNLWYPYGDIR